MKANPSCSEFNGYPHWTFAAPAAFAALLFIGAAPASIASEFAPPIILTSPNPGSGNSSWGEFGTGLSSVPDVDGDGKADIIVAAFTETSGDSPADSGRVYLFNGVTGAFLRELKSPDERTINMFGQTFGSEFGHPVAGIGDLNGNGRGEVIVGTEAAEDKIYVLDGATGETIHTIEQSGSVSAVPDLNGDGRPEIVVGRRREGVASIYDGASGQLLTSISGTGFFGYSVSGIPDVNGDGAGDVIVGAWRGNRAYIYDGTTGALLHTLTGSGDFARSVAGLGDVNGDGRGDVAMGANDLSRAYIYDGATGKLLHTLSVPEDPNHFGWVVNRLPDVDGDGRDDVVVAGFPNASQRPANAYVFSSATGELVATLPGHSDFGGGRSIAGLPDVNGDGLGEILVAHPFRESNDGEVRAGQVSVFLSKKSAELPALTVLGWIDEGLRLRLASTAGVSYELQASEDLVSWINLANPPGANGEAAFVDTDAKNKRHRFYRTRSVP